MDNEGTTTLGIDEIRESMVSLILPGNPYSVHAPLPSGLETMARRQHSVWPTSPTLSRHCAGVRPAHPSRDPEGSDKVRRKPTLPGQVQDLFVLSARSLVSPACPITAQSQRASSAYFSSELVLHFSFADPSRCGIGQRDPSCPVRPILSYVSRNI